MNIVINGVGTDTDCATLAALLAELEHTQDSVATAVNGVFVPATERHKSVLNADDEIDILAPMCGG